MHYLSIPLNPTSLKLRRTGYEIKKQTKYINLKQNIIPRFFPLILILSKDGYQPMFHYGFLFAKRSCDLSALAHQ